jgi:hypothetical protein
VGQAGFGDLTAAVGAGLGGNGGLGGVVGDRRVDPAVAELGGDGRSVKAAFGPALGDRAGQGGVVDQADPLQPLQRLGDRRRLEAALLQPLPELGPGARPGREQPQGGGVGGIGRRRPLAVQRCPTRLVLTLPRRPTTIDR